jgi:membrane fusion protein (multidrug efflux system)
MKNWILIIGIAIVAYSCGSKSTDSLAELKQQKDSLKSLYDDIAAQIAVIDQQIKAADTTARLPLVTLNTVEVKPFSHFVEIQGAVETGGNALLYPETPGTITAILVKEGAMVNKGDVIIKLDADVLQSTLKEVETQYELAKDIFEKQERLWKDKIGSEVQYLQAKNNKEALEQKMKTVKQQVGMYVIKAPISGIVDEIMPKVGEAAMPGMPVARVINYSETYVKADVSEKYVGVLKEGTLVNVKFPTIGQEFQTKVKRVADFINPTNRSFKIYIDLSNIKADLKPNLLADISVRDFTLDTAVVLPSSIIQQDRNGNDYVYIIQNSSNQNVVKKVIIKPGFSYQNQTVVLEGLKGDEQYIDKGSRSVQDGDVVEVSKNK